MSQPNIQEADTMERKSPVDPDTVSTESLISEYDNDVIVIGAGLSGLTAAYKLAAFSPLRVRVLEAKDRVGGRIYSVPLKTNNQTQVFDLGGQWVRSSQTNIQALLKKLFLSTCVKNDAGHALNYSVSMWKTFSLFKACRRELYKFVRYVENKARDVKLTNPLQGTLTDEFDAITMETLICKYLTTAAAQNIIKMFIRVAFGVEASQLSPLFFMAYCNSTYGFLNLLNLHKEHDNVEYIEGGAQQISEHLVKNIGKEFIHLNCPVVRITQDDERVYVISDTNIVYRCEYLIVAIPPSEINRIQFSPPLPIQHKAILQKIPMGHLIKFVITYKKNFWKNKVISDEVMKSIWEKCENEHTDPICALYDVTPKSNCPALAGYIASDICLEWSGKDSASRKQSILETLFQLWGQEALHPIEYLEKNWNDEEYVGGCPMGIPIPGVMSSIHIIRVPFNRVFWAGTETATKWCGYMDGAVQSGHRAALEVLYELLPQTVTYQDLEQIGRCVENRRSDFSLTKMLFQWSLIPLFFFSISYFLNHGAPAIFT